MWDNNNWQHRTERRWLLVLPAFVVINHSLHSRGGIARHLKPESKKKNTQKIHFVAHFSVHLRHIHFRKIVGRPYCAFVIHYRIIHMTCHA